MASIYDNLEDIIGGEKEPSMVTSIRVDVRVWERLDDLCKQHKIAKQDIYSWALEVAIAKIEEAFEGKKDEE